jgi:hypothetical protein
MEVTEILREREFWEFVTACFWAGHKVKQEEFFVFSSGFGGSGVECRMDGW